MSEGNIKSILNEERLFQPPTDFVKKATLSATELEQRYALAAEDSNAYWEKMATDLIVWDKPWSQVLDDSKAPNYKWFSGGELNVSANCLDVHLETRADKTAIIFEGEQGDVRHISYAELTSEVSRFANALKASGIGCGDRVVIYMPMVPEAVVAMQACARIGAIHSVVFGGFSAVALRDRINDAGARMLITADGGFRGGSPVELKRAADEALSGGCPTIERVIVLQRTKQDVPMKAGRDIWWSDAIADQCDECAPLPVEASHPLFLLYTSGSTGKPKGVQHGSAGYLLNARLTYETVFDYQEN